VFGNTISPASNPLLPLVCLTDAKVVKVVDGVGVVPPAPSLTD